MCPSLIESSLVASYRSSFVPEYQCGAWKDPTLLALGSTAISAVIAAAVSIVTAAASAGGNEEGGRGGGRSSTVATSAAPSAAVCAATSTMQDGNRGICQSMWSIIERRIFSLWPRNHAVQVLLIKSVLCPAVAAGAAFIGVAVIGGSLVGIPIGVLIVLVMAAAVWYPLNRITRVSVAIDSGSSISPRPLNTLNSNDPVPQRQLAESIIAAPLRSASPQPPHPHLPSDRRSIASALPTGVVDPYNLKEGEECAIDLEKFNAMAVLENVTYLTGGVDVDMDDLSSVDELMGRESSVDSGGLGDSLGSSIILDSAPESVGRRLSSGNVRASPSLATARTGDGDGDGDIAAEYALAGTPAATSVKETSGKGAIDRLIVSGASRVGAIPVHVHPSRIGGGSSSLITQKQIQQQQHFRQQNMQQHLTASDRRLPLNHGGTATSMGVISDVDDLMDILSGFDACLDRGDPGAAESGSVEDHGSEKRGSPHERPWQPSMHLPSIDSAQRTFSLQLAPQPTDRVGGSFSSSGSDTDNSGELGYAVASGQRDESTRGVGGGRRARAGSGDGHGDKMTALEVDDDFRDRFDTDAKISRFAAVDEQQDYPPLPSQFHRGGSSIYATETVGQQQQQQIGIESALSAPVSGSTAEQPYNYDRYIQDIIDRRTDLADDGDDEEVEYYG